MNGAIPRIGRCIGCDRAARLDDGVCGPCLCLRGRWWAEMSNRCRTDLAFARAVYWSIRDERGRRIFVLMYGDFARAEARPVDRAARAAIGGDA